MGPFTVFDLETTGLSPARDRIVEIAGIRVETDGSQKKFEALVNPRRPIPRQASQVHGITDEMVGDAPSFESVGREFLSFASGSTLVAHNARFDLGFLQESLFREGLGTWEGKTLDSIRLMKQAYSGLPSYSLQELRRNFALDDTAGPAHRAGADAAWTLEIFSLALQALLKRAG
ncbi:MAG: hypothetical protein A2X49_10805 [Lentisphaerae bacterium GWF2_52_8]|nr:MAG: hypothetical protein A2X49_10805 [Lentisphaerae bacterium GWF2_52_8]